MLRKAPFVHKLLERLDKLSPREIQKYFEELASENAALDQILDHLEEGVLILDENGMIQYANRQSCRWIFQDAESGREHQKISEIISDAPFSTWVLENLDALKDPVTKDFDLIAPRELRIRASLLPLVGKRDKKILLLLSQLQGSEPSDSDKLYHLTSLLRLSAGIAHEIGNPLNSIGIHLELLKKQIEGIPADAKRKNVEKNLNVIRAETQRLDHIIKNFLKATRRPPLRFKTENLNQLLEAAISFMEPELRQNRVALQFLRDPALPDCLVDRERLHQVFINLIKNSMEAIAPKDKGGKLDIRITHRGKALWLRFKDDGLGIEEKDLPHIFEAYFTTKKEGSGLGLMTVYQIVREHGGRIEVASRPGKGSEFTIILPIRQPKLQLT
ncbi:MAG: hypothetical protein EXS63_01775 [Candidatus Omnitrophica bacterium]|nr:hypothetical protein [Candidatus Omnitrophota bacterium]